MENVNVELVSLYVDCTCLCFLIFYLITILKILITYKSMQRVSNKDLFNTMDRFADRISVCELIAIFGTVEFSLVWIISFTFFDVNKAWMFGFIHFTVKTILLFILGESSEIKNKISPITTFTSTIKYTLMSFKIALLTAISLTILFSSIDNIDNTIIRFASLSVITIVVSLFDTRIHRWLYRYVSKTQFKNLEKAIEKVNNAL